MPIRNVSIDFSDMSGGKNSAFPHHAVDKNQVVESLNALHEMVGISRAPGYSGITAAKMFSKAVTGFFTYTHSDGTSDLIAVANGVVYRCFTNGDAPIAIGTINGNGQCYAVNAVGKLWIVNGTDFVKVEDNFNVYKVGIAAPTETQLLGDADGGTLPTGTYQVYLAYARKLNGQYLYSAPTFAGAVDIVYGKQITAFVGGTNDQQVTNVVAFVTDANGNVPYYYGENDLVPGTSGASIIIKNDDNKLSTVLMSAVSANNQPLPIVPSGIYTFNDRIYVWSLNDRTVYWSLKTDVNAFDMERYLSENFRTMANSISAMFSVGTNLYFNHKGVGISMAVEGDMSGIIKLINRAYWFLDCRTPDGKSNVCFHKGAALGLTNDGFRFFDGTDFSDDISFHIKPDIDALYNTVGGTLPCALVYRRQGKRTEYRFSFRNVNYGADSNNDQLVFNLDFFFDPNGSRKSWESWENGFAHMVSIDRSFVAVQVLNDESQVVSESGVSDINCFDRDGNFNTALFLKQIYVQTRTHIDDLDAIDVWGQPYTLSDSAATISGNIIVIDSNYSKFPFTIIGSPVGAVPLPQELPFVMNPQYPLNVTDPVSFACRGNSVSIEISQTADDPLFKLYKIALPRVKQIKHDLT